MLERTNELKFRAMSFQIPDVDTDKLISTTHYYKWLTDAKKDNIHNIGTKTEYLEEMGFKVGVDKLGEISLRTLKAIEEVYYRDLLKIKQS